MPNLKQPPPGRLGVGALLRADRFRLGPRTGRVRQNLATLGGADLVTTDRAAAWIGDDLPPLGVPSIALGDARGTLGPHSFGFLDNHRAIAAYSAALGPRPRVGGVAVVCGRREALPEIAPLLQARDLGVSWIISVGDGDAGEVVEFLAADPATGVVLLAAPLRGTPREAGRPLVVLGGDPLLRAAVRRAGGAATDDLETWLAYGTILERAAERIRRPRGLVIGAGAALLARAAAAARLELPITTVPDDEPDEVAQAIEEAAASSDLLLLAGAPAVAGSVNAIGLDLGHAERTRALLHALADRLLPPEPEPAAPTGDRARARAILDEAGETLGDHDTKRALKLYGVRVSRQAPAASATAAQRVAVQLGFPVDIVAERSDGNDSRRCSTAAELRRAAGLLLERSPFVLVRETFATSPRAQLRVRRTPEHGLVATIDEEEAPLPLRAHEARRLAHAAAGSDAPALRELLLRTATAAVELDLTLELELFAGDEPAVIAARGAR